VASYRYSRIHQKNMRAFYHGLSLSPGQQEDDHNEVKQGKRRRSTENFTANVFESSPIFK
ncbi:hypothetical protein HN51_068016, partial [Arachis hypogaea]